MGLITEVVSNGGTLPQLEELRRGKTKLLTRKNGIAFSLFWFLFFVLLVTPFWAILDVEEMAAITAVTGVFGSLILFLFSLFFLGKAPKVNSDFVQGQQQIGNSFAANQGALPPHMQQPATDYISPQPGSWKAPDTDDLVAPGSVTEGTTKLLQKEESDQ